MGTHQSGGLATVTLSHVDAMLRQVLFKSCNVAPKLSDDVPKRDKQVKEETVMTVRAVDRT